MLLSTSIMRQSVRSPLYSTWHRKSFHFTVSSPHFADLLLNFPLSMTLTFSMISPHTKYRTTKQQNANNSTVDDFRLLIGIMSPFWSSARRQIVRHAYSRFPKSLPSVDIAFVEGKYMPLKTRKECARCNIPSSDGRTVYISRYYALGLQREPQQREDVWIFKENRPGIRTYVYSCDENGWWCVRQYPWYILLIVFFSEWPSTHGNPTWTQTWEAFILGNNLPSRGPPIKPNRLPQSQRILGFRIYISSVWTLLSGSQHQTFLDLIYLETLMIGKYLRGSSREDWMITMFLISYPRNSRHAVWFMEWFDGWIIVTHPLKTDWMWVEVAEYYLSL